MSTNFVYVWSHLPNAEHIDRILASFKSHPGQWNMARDVAHIVGQDAYRIVTWVARRGSARQLARAAARNESNRLALALARIPQNGVVRDALLCLIAYDNCAHMLDSEVGELKILAAFGDPRSILLLPACVAFHSIKHIS